MKVGILHIGFMYSGGGERVVIEQTRELRRRGHDVKLLSPVTRWDRCFPELLGEVKPERFTPSFPLPWPFREASAMLASAILPLGIRRLSDRDILLCHSQPSMWIGYRMSKLLGIPYVGYLHQLTTFIHPRPAISSENWQTKQDFMLLNGLLGGPARKLALHLDYLCHRDAAALVFNSCWTRRRFQDVYGLTGSVCYPGVDVKVTPTPLNRRGLITASRHYPWKRIDLALQMVKKLNRRIPLICVGEYTPHTRILRETARRLGLSSTVLFTGYVKEPVLHRLYDESQVYVQTSIQEPFGMGSIEAQTHGLPAVVWDDGGVAETVVQNVTGYKATPYDLDDYAGKVRALLDNPRRWRSMSREARIWASSFQWSSHVDQIEETLEKNSI